MNPEIGRFVTTDPFGGIQNDPVTMHKYLYANANPVKYVDPSGELGILGRLMVAQSIAMILTETVVQSIHYFDRNPIFWEGELGIFQISSGKNAYFSGGSLILINLKTECEKSTIEGKKVNLLEEGSYFIMAGGFTVDFGKEAFIKGDVDYSYSKIKIKTPGIFGCDPNVLQGPVNFISVTSTTRAFIGAGLTHMTMGVGMTEGLFSWPLVGDDKGVDLHWGISIRLPHTWSTPLR